MDKKELWNTISKTAFFNKKCNDCNDRIDQYIKCRKTNGFVLFDSYYVNEKSYVFCQKCFLDTSREEKEEIFDYLYYKTWIPRKCRICLNYFNHIISANNKWICQECFTGNNDENNIKDWYLVLDKKQQNLSEEKLKKIFLLLDLEWEEDSYYDFKQTLKEDSFYCLVSVEYDDEESIEKLKKYSKMINEDFGIKSTVLQGYDIEERNEK